MISKLWEQDSVPGSIPNGPSLLVMVWEASSGGWEMNYSSIYSVIKRTLSSKATFSELRCMSLVFRQLAQGCTPVGGGIMGMEPTTFHLGVKHPNNQHQTILPPRCWWRCRSRTCRAAVHPLDLHVSWAAFVEHHPAKHTKPQGVQTHTHSSSIIARRHTSSVLLLVFPPTRRNVSEGLS